MRKTLTIIGCVAALLGFSQAALAAEAIQAPTGIPGLALWLDASDASTMQGVAYQSESLAKHVGFHNITAWKDKSGKGHDALVVTVMPGGQADTGEAAGPKPRFYPAQKGREKPFVAMRTFSKVYGSNLSHTALDTQFAPDNEFTILVVGSNRVFIHTKPYASYHKDNPLWHPIDGAWNLRFRLEDERLGWTLSGANDDNVVGVWDSPRRYSGPSYTGYSLSGEKGHLNDVGPDDASMVILRRGGKEKIVFDFVGADKDGAKYAASLGTKKMAPENVLGNSTLKLSTILLSRQQCYCEVLAFDRALTDVELKRVREYLESKWLNDGRLVRAMEQQDPIELVDSKLNDPTKWTYPDWSEGLPKSAKEETKATIDMRANMTDYLSLLETGFLEYERPAANMLLEELASGEPFLSEKGPHYFFTFSATITLAVELYERTGKQLYLDWAKMAFEKYLQGANNAHEKGKSFRDMGRLLGGSGTGTYQYGIMVYMMSKYVDLTDQRFKLIRDVGIGASRYDPKSGSPMRMYNCGNHATRQFAGATFLAKAFERDPEVKWLLDGCRFGWKWYQWKQSVQENDSSYGFYCLNPMLQLGRVYGDGVEAFKGQGYQALLERYAYLTTPSGYYPHFGYAIGMYPCIKKVTVAEIAARATDDPGCLYFANKLYSRMFRGLLKNKMTAGGYDNVYCTNLLNMPKTDMRPAAPKVLSKVYRTNQWNLDKESMDKITEGKLNRQIPDRSVIRMGYDKLVLKTSNSPGGAMIMMDLATRRGGADKSHPEMRPAIQYYEAQNTPLWYGFKYTRLSRSSNLVWLTPPDLDFPHMENCEDPERVKRIDTAFNVIDYGRNPQNLKYGDVLAENKRTDAYGLVEFTSYYRPDTSLTRRLLLTHEGILVVRDDLIPGRSVDGYRAGSLWNPLQAATRAHTRVPQRDGGVPQPETGENWWDFAAPRALLPCDLDDTNVYTSELMVYHGRAAGRSFGIKDLPEANQYVTPWPTTYSCQTVKAGVPVTFLMVLIPHPPEVTGKMLADNLSTEVKEGVSTVSLNYKGQTLKMELGKDSKNWQIFRQHP